jgi:hypothetical protein
MTAMPKSRLSAAVYLLLVFLSGALVGGFSHRLYMTRSVNAAPRSPDEWRKKYVSELRERLTLDNQQVNELQQILDETRKKFQQMRDQEKPVAQKIQNEQTDRIRAMLRPDQQQRYEEFRLERERKRQEAERKKGH